MVGNYRKKCCNPFKNHKKVIFNHLRKVTSNVPQELKKNKQFKKYMFNEQSQVCLNCLKKLKNNLKDIIESSSSSRSSSIT
jgi:primosomal protein N''